MEKIFTVSSRERANIEELVGRVIDVDNIEVEKYSGGCCGYADVKVLQNTFAGEVLITDVKVEHSTKYPREHENDILVTFYGLNKQIFEANLFDGSGTGWDYGAVATLKVTIKEDDEESVWP